MSTLATYCRVCLEKKCTNASLYTHVQQVYLPSVIENICGVLISSFDEPDALICRECALAIIQADEIIQKCQESHKILVEQRRHAQEKNIVPELQAKSGLQEQEQWLMKCEAESERQLQSQVQAEEREEETFGTRPMQQEDLNKGNVAEAPDVELTKPSYAATLPETANTNEVKEEVADISDLDNLFVEPQMFVESILENSRDDVTTTPAHTKPLKTKASKTSRSSRSKSFDSNALAATNTTSNNCASSDTTTTIYQSSFKTSKPKKKFIRSREQYLKRKIRNYPIKEPLTLIGGAGVVRKRRPKTFHRAIPNFYFRCELCHEFESNVASYSVTHLSTVHGIERPAIFRCPHCDTKPFIKNQSLQEHIATIHQQQPKARDFVCRQCGKTFIKNCHLQKHMLSVHKQGEMPYRCEVSACSKGCIDAFALRVHMRQVHGLSVTTPIATFKCDTCGQEFNAIELLRAHMENDHPAQTFSCAQCGYKFRQKTRYEAHVRRARCKPPCFACRHCERTFAKLIQLEEHLSVMHAAVEAAQQQQQVYY